MDGNCFLPLLSAEWLACWSLNLTCRFDELAFELSCLFFYLLLEVLLLP